MQENIGNKNLQSSDWNIVGHNDELIIDELQKISKNDCKLNVKCTDKDECVGKNAEDERFKNYTASNMNNIFAVFKTVIAGSLLLFGLRTIYVFYKTYRLENMIGELNDFSGNSDQIKAAFEKCKQKYLNYQEVLDSCIESKINSQSCLDYYAALLNQNKDFCKWNVAIILQEKQKLINDFSDDSLVSNLGSKTKELLISSKGKVDLMSNALTNMAKWLMGDQFDRTYAYIQKFEAKDKSKKAVEKIYQNIDKYYKTYRKEIGKYSKDNLGPAYSLLKQKLGEEAEFLSNKAKKQMHNFKKLFH